jgi:hypothetical protein
MKRVVASLLLFAGLFAAGFTFKPINPIDHTLEAIVRIESLDMESGQPIICTGFVVAAHRALTAVHCLQDDAGFTVDGKDSLVIKKDKYFALVSVSPELGIKPALKLAGKLRLQEPVISFGYAWGDIFVFSRRVAAFKGGDFAMDGALAPGMSGGPTVNYKGEVVGLNQAANNIIGIMCGAGEIRAFLDSQ